MRNEDILKELEDHVIWICKIQKIDILWLKGPFLATAVIYRCQNLQLVITNNNNKKKYLRRRYIALTCHDAVILGTEQSFF